jgi:FAD-linked oxidoreductase
VENESQIISVIEKAKKLKNNVRVLGSGHSFTPLISTQDILLKTENLKGLISYDSTKKSARVRAGTKLHALGHILHEHGLAQENLGDIDVQSLAGAMSTGTHGTGIDLGILPSQMLGLTFINGKGEKIECSEQKNPDIFKVAQVSLGLLGVITEIELKLEDSYLLKCESKKEKLDTVLEQFDFLNQENRNFEFLWFPYTNIVQAKLTNKLPTAVPVEHKIKDWFDSFVENNIYDLISKPTRSFPGLSQYIAKLSGQLVPTSTKINWSHKVYATPRKVPFYEMEYSIPYEAFKEVKKECVRIFAQKKFPMHFPTENRFTKGDDIYLSLAHERKSAYIAFHAYKGTDYRDYFKTMEEICVAHEGRPHWGKIHTKTAAYFEKVYPKWNDFLKIREQMDPDQIFVSEYMRSILF